MKSQLFITSPLRAHVRIFMHITIKSLQENFKLISVLFLYLYIYFYLFVQVLVCAIWMQYWLPKPEEDIRSPGAGFRSKWLWAALYGLLVPNSSSLEDQQVLLTTEPTLQTPPTAFRFMSIFTDCCHCNHSFAPK